MFFLFISSIFIFYFLYPIFKSEEIIIRYGIKPFDICQKNKKLWNYLKIIYIFLFIFSNLIYSNFIYKKIINLNLFNIKKIKKNKKEKNNKKNNIKKINKIKKIKSNKNENKKNLNLIIGYDKKNYQDIILPESGLYQNFLITGTIGTGKTSSAMYPFTENFLKFNFENPNNKIGILILDVKGNYYFQIKKYAKKYNLLKDLIVIELGGKDKYNPIYKPNLKANVLANRLRTILELFSENNSESYWIDKAEEVLNEAIKLCRICNDGYITFLDIHKIITDQKFYKEKINKIKQKFINSKLNNKQIYELNSALDFFQNEFEKLDERTREIIKSEITRITNTFISDYSIKTTFCPKKEELNFFGFEELLKKGKIVVLNMNIAEYRNLSKIIAAYLKLDFQSEVMINLSKGQVKPSVFICDEYSEYVTKTDSNFFSLSREAKCINIVSTQSYSSIKNTLKDDTATKVICQNLINKIWFRTDDIFTIEEAQKQLGKEEKAKTSKNISESARKTKYDYITGQLINKDGAISESYNLYTQNDFVYDTNFFTQELETFSALAFLSDGRKILKPRKLNMYPYFLKEYGKK